MNNGHRAILLHAAVWLQRLNGYGRPYPATVLASEIKRGERLHRWTCHEGDDFTFEVLEKAGLTGAEEPYSYDGMLHPLTFERPTLREELEANNLGQVDHLSIVRMFAEQVITKVGPESEKLAPWDDSWFVPWAKLTEAFDVLAVEGYMGKLGNRYRLHHNLLTLLKERGWSVELDTKASNMRLMNIWETMPTNLKEELSNSGGSGALSLAVAMGYFWDEERGWVDGSLAGMDPNHLELKGGHIPTAIRIVDLLRAKS